MLKRLINRIYKDSIDLEVSTKPLTNSSLDIEFYSNLINKFNPKDLRGLDSSEIDLILRFTSYKRSEFNEKLGVNTCIITKEGETLTFPTDILRTLVLLVEDREATVYEWD